MPFAIRTLSAALACAVVCSATLAQADQIISETAARRHGLTRAWVTRLQIDPGRGRVIALTLHDGTLFSVTNDATVQALDAETGRTLWITKIGKSHLVCTPAGASPKFVAACCGSTLTVIDRETGGIIMSRRTAEAPSAAPAVSDQFAYVPTFGGAIEAYPIDRKKDRLPPIIARGNGMILQAPVLAGESLIWGTEKGMVYSASPESLLFHYRFKTRGPISAGLGYKSPLVFASSADGYVYAIHETQGERRWQFSTGYPLHRQPVPIRDVVFAISDLTGMYCLTQDKGLERWFARDVDEFLAASATRLYVTDRSGALLMLDAASGAQIDRVPANPVVLKVINIQTDRLYLASPTGLVQCVHEVDQVQPLIHVQRTLTAEEKTEAKKKARQEAREAPADTEPEMENKPTAPPPPADDDFADEPK